MLSEFVVVVFPQVLTPGDYAIRAEKKGSGRTALPPASEDGPGALSCPSKPTTVKVAELDVPPPGAALKTVIVLVPRLRMSLFEIWAVSLVELINVVGRGEPLT